MKGVIFIQVLLISGIFIRTSSAGCQIPEKMVNVHRRLKERFQGLLEDIKKAKVSINQGDIGNCAPVIKQLVLVNYNHSMSRIRFLMVDTERFVERLGGYCWYCSSLKEMCTDINERIKILKETRQKIKDMYNNITAEGPKETENVFGGMLPQYTHAPGGNGYLAGVGR